MNQNNLDHCTLAMFRYISFLCCFNRTDVAVQSYRPYVLRNCIQNCRKNSEESSKSEKCIVGIIPENFEKKKQMLKKWT